MLFLEQLNPSQIEVEIRLTEVHKKQDRLESELDEMWSYVAKKENQRWLWHAIDPEGVTRRSVMQTG